MNVYSHYNGDKKLLDDHLEEVSNKTKNSIVDPSLRDLGYYCGYFHDFGKYDPKFQKYLKGDIDSGGNHAPFSSVVLYYILKENDFDVKERVIGLISVYCHHMSLPNNKIEEHIKNKIINNDSFYNEFLEKIKRINNKNVSEVRDLFNEFDCSWYDFVKEVRSNEFDFIADDIKSVVTFSSGSISDDVDYSELIIVWSSLNFSDKRDAMRIPNNYFDYNSPNIGDYNDYIKSLDSDSELNKMRQKASDDVSKNIDLFYENDYDIASINLPTGMGKTLTGLRASLKLANHKGDNSNIIYALPYTSIIDQTNEELLKIYNSDSVVTDHYLSDTEVTHKTTKKEYKSFLGETWSSNIILTTFVQLFESFVGPSNFQSTKLSNLEDSVIILDEPQSLPYKWWDMVNKLGKIMINKYNANIISMTATHPYIFEMGEFRTMELVDDPEKYFNSKKLSRVNYNFDETFWSGMQSPHLTYEELSTKICDNNHNNSLVICNTIDSSRQLTEVLEDSLGDYSNLNEKLRDGFRSVENLSNQKWLMNLTSRHRPKERKKYIKIVKKLVSEYDTKIILVSTQVVEAGVDISFEAVYRDLAPVDKIVQAAGRCNRNNEKDVGQVYVYSLKDESGDSLSKKIYNTYNQYNLITPTIQSCRKNFSPNDEKISQSKVNYDAVNEYYDILKQRNIGDKELVNYIDDKDLKELNRLSLIEDNTENADLIIPIDEEEFNIIREIREEFKKQNFSKVRELKKDLKNITVSIPLYSENEKEKIQQLPRLIPKNEHSKLRVVDRNNNRYYNSKFGVKLPEDSVSGRII